MIQAMFFSAHRRISAYFTRILDPLRLVQIWGVNRPIYRGVEGFRTDQNWLTKIGWKWAVSAPQAAHKNNPCDNKKCMNLLCCVMFWKVPQINLKIFGGLSVENPFQKVVILFSGITRSRDIVGFAWWLFYSSYARSDDARRYQRSKDNSMVTSVIVGVSCMVTVAHQRHLLLAESSISRQPFLVGKKAPYVMELSFL